MKPFHQRARRQPPRAMITVAVLVCLVVILLISASLMRMARSQRTMVRSEEREIQADWLAESGLDRAAARLARDSGYAGETWEVPARELGGLDAGVVIITVEPPQGESNRRAVTVQADYPIQPEHRVRRSKQFTIDTQ